MVGFLAGDLTRLLLEHEDSQIRRGRLQLAERYFDYEATAAGHKELSSVRSYLGLLGDLTNLTHEEKMQRVQAMLFGWNHSRQAETPPDSEKSKAAE